MAPVFSLMEAEVLAKLRELIGWSSGDGIFSPGGSISNMYGLLAARFHKFPETKTKGTVGLPPMVLFGSEQVCGQKFSRMLGSVVGGMAVHNTSFMDTLSLLVHKLYTACKQCVQCAS